MKVKEKKRTSSIEQDPRREEIERDIISGMSYRKIAEKYDGKWSYSAIHKYAYQRLGELLAQSPKMSEWNGDRIVREIERQMEMGNKLLDACSEALEDPDHPGRFTLDPTATDIEVVYIDTTQPVPTKRRATLQQLLNTVASGGTIHVDEYKYAKSDPRKLLLDSIGKLGGHLELLAKVKGEIQDAAITIVKSETWQSFQALVIENLKDYPEVREALADRLREL